MSHAKDQAQLMRTLGYEYRDPGLLTCALTHSSYANESTAKGIACPSNERLEYLGDAVLQLYISDYLYEAFPDCAEKQMTDMRKYLVCETTLARIAGRIGLGDYLRLGHGEEQKGGREKPSILADAFEALLASLYMDSGRLAGTAAHEVLFRLMEDELASAPRARMDYKTRFQQLVQKDGSEQLSYVTVSESGPDHDKVFEVEALVNSNVVGRGKGRTKREAEQDAARQALELFGFGDN